MSQKKIDVKRLSKALPKQGQDVIKGLLLDTGAVTRVDGDQVDLVNQPREVKCRHD